MVGRVSESAPGTTPQKGQRQVTAHIILQPAAQRDLDEIADYLSKRSLRAAIRFSHEVSHSFQQLAEMPELGGLYESAHPALEGARVWRVRKFKKYLMFYRVVQQDVQMLRVLHGARDIESLLRG